MTYETIPEKVIKVIFKYPFTTASFMLVVALLIWNIFSYNILVWVGVFMFMICCFSEVMMDYLYAIVKEKDKDKEVG